MLFVVLSGLPFIPIGGGAAHLLFAHSPGGNLAGARIVFAGFLLATALVTAFLRATRYPGPWFASAALAGAIALWAWSGPVLAPEAGDAFRRQGLLLAPLLPLAAVAVAAWSERRRRRRHRTA